MSDWDLLLGTDLPHDRSSPRTVVRTDPERTYLTVLDVAEVRRAHRNTVINWIRVGCQGIRLRAVKVGRKWLISPIWLQQFANALTQKAYLASLDPAEAALIQEITDAVARWPAPSAVGPAGSEPMCERENAQVATSCNS